jgi:predicted nuclease with TOPRIM domain
MFKFNIDIKSIFIIVLGLIIVFMILFRPSKDINQDEEKINLLNQKNEILLNKNDSINSINNNLQIEINSLNKSVDSVNIVLGKNEKQIIILKKRKGEIFNNVNNMDVNGVTRNLTNYLKRNH